MNITVDLVESAISRPPRPSAQEEPRTVHALVLLGFSAYLLAFARRARSAGIRVHLIDLVLRPQGFVRRSSAVEPEGITLPWSTVGTPEGLAAIHSFVDKVHADALLTTDDFTLTWLGKHRASFEPRCRLMIPQPAVLEPLLDKSRQIDRAQECGFDLLPSWRLTSAEAIAAIPDEAFPVVIRPRLADSARPSFKALVMRSRQDLSRLYASTQWTLDPIAQPFRLGPNYILHGVRAQCGELLDLRLFKAYRKYHGYTTSMAPAPLPAGLESAARRFVEAEGLTGPFHFEPAGRRGRPPPVLSGDQLPPGRDHGQGDAVGLRRTRPAAESLQPAGAAAAARSAGLSPGHNHQPESAAGARCAAQTARSPRLSADAPHAELFCRAPGGCGGS